MLNGFKLIKFLNSFLDIEFISLQEINLPEKSLDLTGTIDVLFLTWTHKLTIASIATFMNILWSSRGSSNGWPNLKINLRSNQVICIIEKFYDMNIIETQPKRCSF